MVSQLLKDNMPSPDSFLRPFGEPPPSHTTEFIWEVVPAPPSVYTFRYPIREALIPKPSRNASRSLNLHTCSEPSATSEQFPDPREHMSCLLEEAALV